MRFKGKIVAVSKANDNGFATIYVSSDLGIIHHMTARYRNHGTNLLCAEEIHFKYLNKHIVGISIRTHKPMDFHLCHDMQSTNTNYRDSAVSYGFVIQELDNKDDYESWMQHLFST
jgi:hypothetical protein